MKFLTTILSVTFAIFFYSCSNDSPSSPDSKTNQVKDDFNYLIVNSSGKINKIGNNSGKITPYSQFDGLTASPIILNSVTSNTDKIFLIEYYSGITKIFIFDKKTKTTSSKSLVFPKEIIGPFPSISSLTWDDSKKILYGIIVGNTYNSPINKISYLVNIDPNTFDVSYSGLSFDQTASISTFLSSNKLYSSYNQDTYEINTETNTVKKALFNNSKISLIKPAVYLNNTAYCITDKTNNVARNTIAKINLTNNTYEDLLPQESLGYSSSYGSGYIDTSNNEYICYLQKDSEKFVLLKFNFITKTYKYFELKSDSTIDTNFIIVDKIN